MEINTFYNAAFTYRAMGYPVFPCAPESKIPLVEWTEFQYSLPDEETLFNWWKEWPYANIAVVTGWFSRIVVVDVDGPRGQKIIESWGIPPGTPCVSTCDGKHYYFSYPDYRVPTYINGSIQIDIKSDGAYVMAPPSIHPDGVLYDWLSVPFLGLPNIPQPIHEYIQDQKAKKNPKSRVNYEKKIESSKRDWKRARKEIKKHSDIIEWLKTSKPDDRSGHDWGLAMLCLEHGISEGSLLYQILLHNEYGKAGSRKRDQEKYITKLIHRAKSEYKTSALYISAHDLSKMEFSESHGIIGKGVLSP
ncbi:MAG: bifunctional DNA primase/polymerase, partial [bacterium]